MDRLKGLQKKWSNVTTTDVYPVTYPVKDIQRVL